MPLGEYLIAVGRESTSALQFYSNCLPMSYIIEQQTILFYQRILRSTNNILHTLFQHKNGSVLALLHKYNIAKLSLPREVIKSHIWHTFVTNSVNAGHITVS